MHTKVLEKQLSLLKVDRSSLRPSQKQCTGEKAVFLSRLGSIGCFLQWLDLDCPAHCHKENAICIHWNQRSNPRDHGWLRQSASASWSSWWLIHCHLHEAKACIPLADFNHFRRLRVHDKAKQRPCPCQKHAVFKSSGCCETGSRYW